MSERYISPFPLPTPREAEVLENLAEVIHRTMKILRFGLDEVQRGQELNNRQRLSREVGNLLEMLCVARSEGILSDIDVEIGQDEKNEKLKKYMQN